MKRYSALSVCAVAVLLAARAATAAQFLDIDFDADGLGAAPSTGVTSSPITKIGALGGYTPSAFNVPPNADNGTIVVDNVAGMTKAAVLTTNSANPAVGALFMDTGLGVVSSQLSVKFDIAVLAAPASATSQAPYVLDGSLNNTGVLFGVRAYNSTANQWAFSFAVTPTSETGGVFALRDITNTQLTSFGTYVEGEKHNIAITTNYTTGTVDAYVDGVLGYSGYPSRTGPMVGNSTTSELFIYFNGESGSANQVAIDNIQAFDTIIPEPASLGLLGLGVSAMLLYGRRRAAK